MTFSPQTLVTYIQTVYANRHEPEYAHAFADLYWYLLLGIASVVIVGGCVYGTWQFIAIGHDASQTTSKDLFPSGTKSTFSRTDLEHILQTLTERKNHFQSLDVTSIPSVADPH
jgi:hypothetical protein